MRKNWQENKYKHTQEKTPRIYVVWHLAYIHGHWQKIFSLIKVENTKWCNSTLTSHNAQIPIHPNYSLIQIQSSLSIQKLGPNTKFGFAPNTKRSSLFSHNHSTSHFKEIFNSYILSHHFWITSSAYWSVDNACKWETCN